MAYLPVSAVWKEILTIPTDKKIEMECYGAETIVKFCSQKVLILIIVVIYPEGGASRAKCFVGVTGNDTNSKHDGWGYT